MLCNLKECRRKWFETWLKVHFYGKIDEYYKKPVNSKSLGQDLKMGHPKYEARVLTTASQLSMSLKSLIQDIYFTCYAGSNGGQTQTLWCIWRQNTVLSNVTIPPIISFCFFSNYCTWEKHCKYKLSVCNCYSRTEKITLVWASRHAPYFSVDLSLITVPLATSIELG